MMFSVWRYLRQCTVSEAGALPAPRDTGVSTLWRRVSFIAGSQAYGLVAAIVSLLLTARWLGPEGRGTIAFVTTWVAAAAGWGGLSLGSVTVHLAADQRSGPWLGPTLGTLLRMCLAITGLVWAIALVTALVSDSDGSTSTELLSLGFLSLPFLLWEQYGSALLSATNQTNKYGRALVAGRSATLISILVAWAMDWGLPAVLLSMVAGQATVALGGLRGLVGAAGGLPRFDAQTCRALLRGAIRLHPAFVGGVLVTSPAVLVVGHVLGPDETGWYQLAAQLSGVLGFLPQAGGLVISGRVATEGPEQAWSAHRQVIVGVLFGVVVMACVAAIMAPIAIPWVVGNEFAPAVPVFWILLLSSPGMALGPLMAPQWIGRGYLGRLSAVVLGLGGANVAALFLAVPRAGIQGAAWVTAAVYGAALLVHGRMAWHCEKSWRRRKQLEPRAVARGATAEDSTRPPDASAVSNE